MAATIFCAKVNVSSTVQLDVNSFQLEASIVDYVGIYSGMDVTVGDKLLLDTGFWAQGTVSSYLITSVESQDPSSFMATVRYDDSDDIIDPAYTVDLDGFIYRPTPNLGLIVVPSPSVQGLPDYFAIYPINENFASKVDSISTGGGSETSTFMNAGSADVAVNGIVVITSATTVQTADISDSSLNEGSAFCIAKDAVAVGNSGAFYQSGAKVGGFNALQINKPVYLGIDGAVTQHPEFDMGNQVVQIGMPVSTTEILFQPKYIMEF